MKVLVVIFEFLSAIAAGVALYAGWRWAQQDHADTEARKQREDQLERDITDLEGKEKAAYDWLQTPTTDVARIKEAKVVERDGYRQELAQKRAELAALNGELEGVPVATSWKAFTRAKMAGKLGMAAVILGAFAGIFGLFTGSD